MRGQKLSQLKDAMYSILRDMREGKVIFYDLSIAFFLIGVRIKILTISLIGLRI